MTMEPLTRLQIEWEFTRLVNAAACFLDERRYDEFVAARRPMVLTTCVLIASLLPGATSCTVLFDPENLDTRLGTAGMTLEPSVVDEGVGASRAMPVLLRGTDIATTATVRLWVPGVAEPEDRALQVSPDGTLAAFELSIPVLTGLDEGDIDAVRVDVLEDDVAVASLDLNVRGLDELVASELGATLDVSAVWPRYSRITIDRAITATGDAPIQLVATSAIEIAALLYAGGQEGDRKTGGAPGPGGCRGGAAAQLGQCNGGGGSADPASNSGGGGGGHAEPGVAGTGEGAGIGGAMSGSETLIPLAAQRGGGGSGGGDEGGTSGGGGGGSGGVLELTSLGRFTLSAGAQLSVQGGAGQPCKPTSGDGGGGSGGAILLRAPGEIEGSAAVARLLVLEGGVGGTGAVNCSQGGKGGRGRARIDAASLPSSVSDVAPYHGAVISVGLPTIVRTEMLSVPVRGAAGRTYALSGTGGTSALIVDINPQGQGAAMVTLSPGMNRLCVSATETLLDLPETKSCLDVAFVPLLPAAQP
jgi:hypothetical protein